MIAELPFHELMSRVRAGDPMASAAVFERMAGPLILFAHKKLPGWLRSKEDPEDVLQSAYRSFFFRAQAGEYQLGAWRDLWSLLYTIIDHKCQNRNIHYRRQKRDSTRERPLSEATHHRQPSPEMLVHLAEEIRSLLDRLDSPEREVIKLTLQGLDSAEIGRRVGYSQRSVQRVQKYIRDCLAEDN